MKKEDLVKLKEFLSNLSSEELKDRDLYLKGLASKEIMGPEVGYPTIDKPWLKYYDSEEIIKDVPDMSIYQYAYVNNLNNMNNVAFDIRTSKNNFESGIKIKYKNFFKNITRVAKSLKALDIKEDEIVPLIVPNVPQARELIYANSYNGSISYPISPLLPSQELKRIIHENNIKTIFVFSAFYEKYKECFDLQEIKNIIVLDGTESLPYLYKIAMKILPVEKPNYSNKVITYDKFINLGKKINDYPFYYSKDHVTAIIGTSGTTGTSKGVCLTDKNINAVAASYKNGKFFSGNFMDALIPSIGYGISMIHYQTVAGKYVYLIPELLTDKFPEALEKLKPANFPGGPVHYINLYEKNGNKKYCFIENMVSGGASLPKNVEKELNGICDNYSENGKINNDLTVRQGYGLSENTAMGTYSKRGTYKFGSIGIPTIYENIGIFESGTDNELPFNTPGEICISGDAVMKEYLNNPLETENVVMIHQDGKRWIHTKDIGYMDEDGNIFHVDRIKNIFMRCGFNIHPSKIAEFIDSIDIVKQSTVIGFEHPKEQAVPVAFIVIDKEKTKNMSKDDIEKIINDECYKKLEETSIPYEYVFVDELPINAGGKIDIQKLKKESLIDYSNVDDKTLKKVKTVR